MRALTALAGQRPPVFPQRIVELLPVVGQRLVDAGQLGPEQIRIRLHRCLAWAAGKFWIALQAGDALGQWRRAVAAFEFDDLVVECGIHVFPFYFSRRFS